MKYGDARKMLNLNNKYPNLFNGKMTYEELFNYLKMILYLYVNFKQQWQKLDFIIK